MGLVTYIHTYIHTTYIHSCTTAAALARERPAGWLAGWLHSVNQPNVPETWSTLRLCLSLSLSLALLTRSLFFPPLAL